MVGWGHWGESGGWVRVGGMSEWGCRGMFYR